MKFKRFAILFRFLTLVRKISAVAIFVGKVSMVVELKGGASSVCVDSVLPLDVMRRRRNVTSVARPGGTVGLVSAASLLVGTVGHSLDAAVGVEPVVAGEAGSLAAFVLFRRCHVVVAATLCICVARVFTIDIRIKWILCTIK